MKANFRNTTRAKRNSEKENRSWYKAPRGYSQNSSSGAKNFDRSRENTERHPFRKQNASKDTSWEVVSKKYDALVGEKGQYYHENVIMPKLLALMNVQSTDKVLDLGCGQGVLARNIPRETEYLGVDLSGGLVDFAKKRNQNRKHDFVVADITEKLPLKTNDFNKVAIILALQNVENYEMVFKNVAQFSVEGSEFYIVVNHPHFRMPRQSSWQIDEQNKIQYRRVNRYLSPIKIPVDMAPGKGQFANKKLTWSFHNSLQDYSLALMRNGFAITQIHEWISDKNSVGKNSKMENMAREEIPMFMCLVCKKLSV